MKHNTFPHTPIIDFQNRCIQKKRTHRHTHKPFFLHGNECNRVFERERERVSKRERKREIYGERERMRKTEIDRKI